MFTLKRWSDNGLEVYELSEPGGTMARFVPARGGIMAEFACWGVPVFYLDQETLRDPAKNIRGGNPVLFPICGPLEDGRYNSAGGTAVCHEAAWFGAEYALAGNRGKMQTG